MRGLPVILAVALAAVAGGCSAGGVASPSGSGAPASGAATAPSGAGASGAPPAGPITSTGPLGWNRGPYELAGGNYELSWESDGSCTILYFGIVGVDNGFKEEPPTAGDVPISQLKGGSRTIEKLPAGSYFFNVSGLACKTYRGTLTPKG